MTDGNCCLEAQETVRTNWKEQFRLRSSLYRTADGVTLMGTEECRKCGGLWAYDGRAVTVGEPHIYWYMPAGQATIERSDEIEQAIGGATDGTDAAATRALDALDAELRAARGALPWLRLVEQSPGSEWAAIGTWEPRP